MDTVHHIDQYTYDHILSVFYKVHHNEAVYMVHCISRYSYDVHIAIHMVRHMEYKHLHKISDTNCEHNDFGNVVYKEDNLNICLGRDVHKPMDVYIVCCMICVIFHENRNHMYLYIHVRILTFAYKDLDISRFAWSI